MCTSHNSGKLFLIPANRSLQPKPPTQESSKSESVPDKWLLKEARFISELCLGRLHRCYRISRQSAWCDNHGATILETRPLARQHNPLQPKLLTILFVS